MLDIRKYFYTYFDSKITLYENQLNQVREYIPRKQYDKFDCLEEMELLIRIEVLKEIYRDFNNFFSVLDRLQKKD